MLRNFSVAAAWASAALITYGTLTHVGFVYSIYFKLSPFFFHAGMRRVAHLEHVVVFAFLGAIFSFAYPRHFVVACCAVVIGAFGLEYLQNFTPDRHATLVDSCEKALGGVLGIVAARVTVSLGSELTSRVQIKPSIRSD